MFSLEKKIADTARKAALCSASAVLASVGAAFLTAAAWILMAETQSALFAACVIGLVYSGLGVLGLAFALRSPRRPTKDSVNPPDLNGLSPMQLVVVSFMQGLEKGARTKRVS